MLPHPISLFWISFEIFATSCHKRSSPDQLLPTTFPDRISTFLLCDFLHHHGVCCNNRAAQIRRVHLCLTCDIMIKNKIINVAFTELPVWDNSIIQVYNDKDGKIHRLILHILQVLVFQCFKTSIEYFCMLSV